MPIIAESSKTNFQPIEAGTYRARCVSMIEIGTVTEEIKGVPKTMHKVQLGWETCDEKKVFDEAKGEQPYFITKEYTLSMNEQANLRKDLESWRGQKYEAEEAKSFDITKLLGKPCMLTVIHTVSKKNNNTYANVASVSKPMKGDKYPAQQNPTRLLCFDDFDWDLFNSLSDYMKDKIKKSEEFKQLQSPGTVHDETNTPPSDDETEDLPF